MKKKKIKKLLSKTALLQNQAEKILERESRFDQIAFQAYYDVCKQKWGEHFAKQDKERYKPEDEGENKP